MKDRQWHFLFIVVLLVVMTAFAGCGQPGKPYTVTGRVVDQNGNGIGAASITATPINVVVTSDDDGKWSISNCHGAVTITPAKDGWSFSPVNKQVSKAASAVNFTGSDNTFSVSGRVTSYDGSGIADVEISFSNGFTSVTTGTDGTWSKAGLFGIVHITPNKPGWDFNGSNTVSTATTNCNYTATYKISGRIATVSDRTFDNVTLTIGDISTLNVNGSYEYRYIDKAVTITPHKEGFRFDPPSRTITGPSSSVDFIILSQDYTVYGAVWKNGSIGVPGVLMTFSNGFGTTTTNEQGNWSKSGLADYVTVTPSKEGWTFTPTSRQLAEPDYATNFSAISTAETLTTLTNNLVFSINNMNQVQFRDVVSTNFTTQITDLTGTVTELSRDQTINTFFLSMGSTHTWAVSQLQVTCTSDIACSASGTFGITTTMSRSSWNDVRTETGNISFTYSKASGTWKITRMVNSPIMPSISQPPILTLAKGVAPAGPYSIGSTAYFQYGYQNAGGSSFVKIEYKMITPSGARPIGSYNSFSGPHNYELFCDYLTQYLTVAGKYRLELKLYSSYDKVNWTLADEESLEINVM